jgi:hypothetical protein
MSFIKDRNSLVSILILKLGFGNGLEFEWSYTNDFYAVRSEGNIVKIFNNFKEHKAFKTSYTIEGIVGGRLL